MNNRKMRQARVEEKEQDAEEGSIRTSNLIMRLASELPPMDPRLERSPPRSRLPVLVTPGGSIRPKGEPMPLSKEEVEEVLDRNPRHVHRRLNTAQQPPSSTSDLEITLSETPAGISVKSEVEPCPFTSGMTSMPKPGPRALVDYGSDYDSECDDEVDIGITGIVSSEIGIPNDDDLDEPTLNIINDIEHGMDDAIDDLLSVPKDFEWSSDYRMFRGVREEFTGPAPGPLQEYHSAYSAFLDIWDEKIIDLIVLETNRYAKETIDSLKERDLFLSNSRLRQWADTTRDEILLLFGVYVLMGIDARTSLRDYWKGGLLGMPEFRSIMTYNRYILLNKFLYFVPNDETGSVESGMSNKLRKLAPILRHLQVKFGSLYNMGREISIDESLTLFKGRLSWVQAIRSKAARFGIKSYELCESNTGYMSRFQIYTGKSDTFTNTNMSIGADLAGKTTKIVLELLQGLENRGHCVTMDNFYNCPALARYLKSQGFDCLGTLRVSRRNVPNDISKVPKNVAKGTIVARHSGDLSIVAWKDTKVVTIISTYHDAGTYVGSKSGKALVKPVCVRDYNNTMGGVDLKDQKLSMYLMERKRGMKWYMKIFKRLMNVSVHNAFVMYLKSLQRRGIPPITHRDFRYELAQSLVDKHRASKKKIVKPAAEIHVRLRQDILHPPKIVKGAKARRRCQVCYKSKIDKKVPSYCSACDAFLCFEGDCWVKWHSLTEELETEETRGRKRKHCK